MFTKFRKIGKKKDAPDDLHLDRRSQERSTLLSNNKAQAEAALAADDVFGFSVNLPEAEHDEVHQTIAVSLPELAAACTELKKAMRIKDISTTGIGLVFEKPRIKAGTMLTLILATKKARLTTNLKAKVMRHEEGVIGASFRELTKKQEILLSKLVLEGQKRQHAKRTKTGSKK